MFVYERQESSCGFQLVASFVCFSFSVFLWNVVVFIINDLSEHIIFFHSCALFVQNQNQNQVPPNIFSHLRIHFTWICNFRFMQTLSHDLQNHFRHNTEQEIMSCPSLFFYDKKNETIRSKFEIHNFTEDFVICI